MQSSELVLRLPRPDEEQEFLRAHRATSPRFPYFLHHYTEGMPLARYVEVLEELEQAAGAASSRRVPATFLFAFLGERIVGRTSIRHRLNARLERVGGHIGYAVVPEFRGRGFATLILRQSLDIARDRLGLHRVLVTCDEDNAASIRVIEKNGGVLRDVVSGPDLTRPKRRYWIDLS